MRLRNNIRKHRLFVLHCRLLQATRGGHLTSEIELSKADIST